MADNTDLIKPELEQALALERQLSQQIQSIKEATDQIENTWKAVEAAMIEHNVPKLQGDWGYIRINERTSYKVDEEKLPEEYFKKAPDLKKIGSATSLMGKPPAGVEATTKQFLVKKLKETQ